MSGSENLDKLFEAALNEKQAPSRYGTPESLMKDAPAAFKKPAASFQAAAQQPSPSVFKAAPSVFQAAAPARAVAMAEPAVQRDALAEASLGSELNAELAEILDAKIAREKRRRRRGFYMMILFFVAATGGTAGWVVTNPERYEAMKSAIAEIKSVGDIQGMVAKYQKALDKIAVRGKQIDAATTAMGVDPTSVDEHEDPGFDKEMQAMMGEEGGKTTAARDKILRKKFNSVQETGSLIPNKDAQSEKTGEEKTEESSNGEE
jgi:hypothetical protein